MLEGPAVIRRALGLVGQRLAAEGQEIWIVVVGGAALNLRGIVTRTTVDVDIVALAIPDGGRMVLQATTAPLTASLRAHAARVAADLRLAPTWLNDEPADLFRLGLPPGFAEGLQWEDFAGLHVGVASREGLIPLKLYAAGHDRWAGPNRHQSDLVLLRPTPEELAAGALWVASQDFSPAMQEQIHRVIEEVKDAVLRAR
ncbi:MAG: hypothetical protein ABIQ41_05435 [Gemmatimonadales bacterium]